MRFGEALAHARKGKKIARHGWNGKNMYVYMTPGHNIGWSASQTDMLIDDWYVVKEDA